MRLLRISLIVAAMVTALLGVGYRHELHGASAAAVDFSRGHPVSFSYGCVLSSSMDLLSYRYEEILSDRYGMVFEPTGFGMDPEKRKFVDSYNAVARRLLEGKYGAGIWVAAMHQARSERSVRRVEVDAVLDDGMLSGPSVPRDWILLGAARFLTLPAGVGESGPAAVVIEAEIEELTAGAHAGPKFRRTTPLSIRAASASATIPPCPDSGS